MEKKETSIINILTYKLPFDLANQIYNEYQNRLKESNYFIDNVPGYKSLRNNKKTVEVLLALSIFHKRVISNLDGAVKFYGTVIKRSDAVSIKIGKYELTSDEKNKMLGVVMNYNSLIEKFSISPAIMEYYETKEFLKKLKNLKENLKYASIQERNRRKNNKNQDSSEDEIPF